MRKVVRTKAQEIEFRAISAAEAYLQDSSATMRSIAKMYHTSKSTIHRDFRSRLPEIDYELSEKVAKKIESNVDDRASRGGQAFAQACANRYQRKNLAL